MSWDGDRFGAEASKFSVARYWAPDMGDAVEPWLQWEFGREDEYQLFLSQFELEVGFPDGTWQATSYHFIGNADASGITENALPNLIASRLWKCMASEPVGQPTNASGT